MIKILFLSGCCALLLVACHREQFDASRKVNLADSVHLTMTTDSIIFSGILNRVDSNVFTYDQSGQLSEWISSYVAGSYAYKVAEDYTRDDQGRVTRIVQTDLINKGGPSNPDNIDLNWDFYYSSHSAQAVHYLQYRPGSDPALGDSEVLTYTGENLTSVHSYSPGVSSTSDYDAKHEFTYDNAGQMISWHYETRDTLNSFTVRYVFDGKVSPLKMGVEALTGQYAWMSSGNPVTVQASSPGHSFDNKSTTVYTYRADGRPVKSVFTRNTDAAKEITTYFYSR